MGNNNSRGNMTLVIVTSITNVNSVTFAIDANSGTPFLNK